MKIPVLDPTKFWQCPSCGLQHVTKEPRPHTPMHTCTSLKGMVAPFAEVPKGQTLLKHSLVHRVDYREDYVGDEVGVATDEDGRPVMAIRTEKADGSNDTHVFAPTARLTGA